MTDGGPEALGERVLVLAPTARDAMASRDLLAAAGIRCLVCATIADVCREAARGVGAALVTAEAVVGDADGLLAGLLRTQPPWSDLPLIILTPPGDDSTRLLRTLEAVGPMTLMKRPVQVATLVSAVRSALRDRMRQYAVRGFLEERERYRVTLSSIGDAVIATDPTGRVTFLNPVAEALTGWTTAEATDRPLAEVFHIVNETTRREVENPALRALTHGVIVGLANHTVLIARDGPERPIDDSAAPIRDEAGAVSGAVLVFRDITERKHAEETRARLAETLGLALEAGELGTWEWNPATDDMVLSARAGAIYGVEPGRPHLREQLRSLLHPDHRDRAREAAVRAAADRADYDIEYPLVTGRWVAARGRGVYGPDGGLARMIGVVQDVTARKEAEAALRESEERLRVLVNATSDVAYRMSADWAVMQPLDGRHLVASNAAPIRDWMDRNIPDSDHALIRAAIAAAVAGKQTFELEHRVNRADGTIGWTFSRAVPILNAGCIVEWFGTARDVTDQKRAQEEVGRLTAESERRRRLYETVLSATPDFVYVFSLDHRVLYANDALIEMWGRGPDGAIGKTFLEIGYEPWHAAMHDREIDTVRETRKPIRGEVPFNGTHGRRIYDYIFVPVFGADGEVEAVAGTTRDVTDRKAGEEALRASEGRHRALAELAAVTRPLTDPAAIMAASARLLAEHLSVDRCAYAEVEDESVYVITGDHARGVPSIVGCWPVPAFGAEHHRMMRANEPYVVTDTDADPRIGPDDRPAYRATAIRAVICVPLHKDGRFTAAMAVHQQVPREWTPDEIDLVTTVVGRCWEALERARVDRALRERDERLQLFLGNATDYAVIISDTEDRALEWLGGAEQITGWRADEALGQPLEVIFTPEDRAAGVPRAETEKAAAAGRAENSRWHQRKDGSRFFAEGVTVSIRGPDGELRGFGKVFRDATTEKRTEERLRRDAMLLANVHDAVVMTDLEGVVTYWSEGATRLFGWTAEEMIGRPYADRFAEPTRSWVAGEIRSRATGSEWTGEYEDTRKDGSRVWIDARVTSVRDAEGRVAGVLGLSHDITERKRAEDALKEADRKKDDFIALLAHELRNPLAPIRNGLQVIRLSKDAAIRERSQAMMDRQLAHMVRMIDDLLDVSRIGRNKMELRRARVALADVVSSAVETARPAIDEAGHDLTVAVPPDPIYLDADLTRLAQVFSNLLTNSAKYTPRGGRIWLATARAGGDVSVSVRDTGIGIPAESLRSVFDMFSQVDRTFERSSGGLGIGLALVRGLVEMHGGSVTVESEGQGRGSTFIVTLPTLSVGPESASRPEPAGPGPRRRILVVDDNRDGAESLAEMLRLLGHEVHTAHDGLEAVEAAGRVRPELVLMDVGMPSLNGLDATRRIREQPWGRGMAVIALTGWGQAGDRVRSREAGCDGHLVKPVGLTELHRLLAGLPGVQDAGTRPET